MAFTVPSSLRAWGWVVLAGCCAPCQDIDPCSEFVAGRGLYLMHESGGLFPGAMTMDAPLAPQVDLTVTVVRLDTLESVSETVRLEPYEDSGLNLPREDEALPNLLMGAPSTDCGDSYPAELIFEATWLNRSERAGGVHPYTLPPIRVVWADGRQSDVVSLWGSWEIWASIARTRNC